MIQSLKLKAYINAPSLFPLSPEQQQEFNVELLPFLTASQEDAVWEAVGLQDASFREKTEMLLRHVKQFRNWIVPYPLDGLYALLQDGMNNATDAYEKNWCALQLALLLVQEHRDPTRVDTILPQLVLDTEGRILLQAEDSELWVELQTQLSLFQQK